MKITRKWLLVFLPLAAQAVCSNRSINYEIVTGSPTGTYYQIGKNLAKYVAPDACIRLKVLNTHGSVDNAKKLRSSKFPNVKFAIVQNDVMQELILEAKTNKNLQDLVDKLRVIAPLYNEEIHVLSKTNSNIKTFADLKDKRISIGPQGSGTAMTSFLLYKELFGDKPDMANLSRDDFDDALRKLERGDIDAIVKVAGQPVSRLSKKMDASASRHIQLLSYDEKNSAHLPVISYYTTEIQSKNYPWLDHNVQTLSTKAFLITFDYRNPRERRYIKSFVESLRNKLPMLQHLATKGNNTPHPKWKQVKDMCGAKLPGGWKFYDVVDEVCGGSTSHFTNRSNCTAYEVSLGLCK